MKLSLCLTQEKNDSLCTSKTLKIAANSSLETMEGRGQWDGTFNIQKEKYSYKPRISYPAQIFFSKSKRSSHFQIKKTITTLREFVPSE